MAPAMTLLYRYLFPVLWLSWAAYWWALSRNVKPTARREPLASRLLHVIPLVLAVLLLGVPRIPLPVLGDRFLPLTAWPFWAGAALTAGGLLFTVWARIHIGMNWSGIVTIQARSRAHHLRSLRDRASPHLRGASAGLCRFSACPCAMARRSRNGHCLVGPLAQTAIRGAMDARAVRRAIPSVQPTCRRARSLPALIPPALSFGSSPICVMSLLDSARQRSGSPAGACAAVGAARAAGEGRAWVARSSPAVPHARPTRLAAPEARARRPTPRRVSHSPPANRRTTYFSANAGSRGTQNSSHATSASAAYMSEGPPPM